MISVGMLLGILIFVPVILGNTLQYILKEEDNWLIEWVRGFIVELGMFFLSFLLFSWSGSYNFRIHGMMFVFIISGICIYRCIFFLIKRRCLPNRHWNYKKRYNWIDFIFIIGITLLICTVAYSAVMTGIPEDSQDSTLEVINAVWKSNTIGVINPYTGREYFLDQTIYKEPAIAVFWAFVSWISRLHPAVLTGTVLPIFFIVLFYAFCYNLSLCFWGTNIRKSEIFILSILFLHILGSQRSWLLFYQLRSEAWMGDHILAFLLLPMTLFEIMKLSRSYLFLMILFFVSFMISENSWFYMAVMLTLSVIMYIGRKLWDC